MSRRKNGRRRTVRVGYWKLLPEGRLLVNEDVVRAAAAMSTESSVMGGLLVIATTAVAMDAASEVAAALQPEVAQLARSKAREALQKAADAFDRHMASPLIIPVIAVAAAEIETAIDTGDTATLERWGLTHIARIPLAGGPKGEA